MWCWSEEFGKSLSKKRLKYKGWWHAKETTVDEYPLAEYEMAKKVAKKIGTQSQHQERKKSEEKLNMEEEDKSVFRIAK